ncbi:hypothetical protein C8D72_0447 [Kushneria indalinina DSM 14324]|uniref:Uncharacterized protein n=1 Tax=Kushneria indalinina DSM 14324 TaxID=1122140 RepID=A0A3D9DYB9_9GAMM|nr:hypothetical protein C8D72_0447 [Kushneria indalinina DSM 14324]
MSHLISRHWAGGGKCLVGRHSSNDRHIGWFPDRSHSYRHGWLTLRASQQRYPWHVATVIASGQHVIRGDRQVMAVTAFVWCPMLHRCVGALAPWRIVPYATAVSMGANQQRWQGLHKRGGHNLSQRGCLCTPKVEDRRAARGHHGDRPWPLRVIGQSAARSPCPVVARGHGVDQGQARGPGGQCHWD